MVQVIIGSDRQVYTLDPLEERVYHLSRQVGSALGVSGQAILDHHGICFSMTHEAWLQRCEADMARVVALHRPARKPGSNWLTLDLYPPDGTVPDVPLCPACYAFYGDGRLVYVGSTECLADRIQGHAIRAANYSSAISTPWGTFGTLVVKFRPSRKYGDWAMVELRLIRRLQPRGNKKGIRKAKLALGVARA